MRAALRSLPPLRAPSVSSPGQTRASASSGAALAAVAAALGGAARVTSVDIAVMNMPINALKRSHTVTSFEPFTLLAALANSRPAVIARRLHVSEAVLALDHLQLPKKSNAL
mgnify:CR=1 FL=1